MAAYGKCFTDSAMNGQNTMRPYHVKIPRRDMHPPRFTVVPSGKLGLLGCIEYDPASISHGLSDGRKDRYRNVGI